MLRVAEALEVDLAWLVRPEGTRGDEQGEGLVEELLCLLRELPGEDLRHVVDLARLEKEYLAALRV